MNEWKADPVMTGTKTVAVVAMLDSVHTARWLERELGQSEYRFQVFPSGPHRRIHSRIKSLETHHSDRLQVFGKGIWGGIVSWATDRLTGSNWQLRELKAAITSGKELKFIFMLETQHAGYKVDKLLGDIDVSMDFKLVLANWGSDLNWFLRYSSHRPKIRSLLSKVDFYFCECERDIALARENGYTGITFKPRPNSFFEFPERPIFIHPKSRKVILIKGYQGWAGRSLLVMEALRRNRSLIADYEVVLFSSDLVMRLLAPIYGYLLGVSVKANKKNSLGEKEMARLFGTSVVYVGASRTDGISTSALEAMAFGCFPIQTDTSCAAEWFLEGQSGLSPSLTVDSIGAALVEALSVCSTTQSYQLTNWEIVKRRVMKNSDIAQIELTD